MQGIETTPIKIINQKIIKSPTPIKQCYFTLQDMYSSTDSCHNKYFYNSSFSLTEEKSKPSDDQPNMIKSKILFLSDKQNDNDLSIDIDIKMRKISLNFEISKFSDR